MMSEEEIRQFLAGLDREAAPKVKKVRFPEFKNGAAPGIRISLEYLEDIQIEVAAELGEVTISVRQLLELAPGSIIRLDRAAGETIDLMMNGVKFARGEVLVINDVFALRVHHIFSPRALSRKEESS